MVRWRPFVRAVFLFGIVAGIGCGTRSINVPSPEEGGQDAGANGRPGRTDAPVDPGEGEGVDPDRNNCPLGAELGSKTSGEPCGCHPECQTGSCVAGVCCPETGCVNADVGVPCQRGAECASGFCADGVCCNLACNGPCVSCGLPEFRGECHPVPAGIIDPHGVCRLDPPESCGESGYCNGQGGCAKYAVGTVCALGACAGPAQFVPPSACDGAGSCIAGVAISCAPSICDGDTCRESCTMDEHCAPGNACVNGTCGPRGDGRDCSAGVDCASGNCVEGICCDSPCQGTCMTCVSPDSRGRCVPTRAGTSSPACADQGPSSCGTNGRCDGAGDCQRYEDGTTCRAASCDPESNRASPAGTCQGGRCVTPSPRSCAPYQGCSGNRCRTTCNGNGQCSDENLCTGGDCGKRENGALCSRAQDCASGICASGRCCATACGGSCRSCSVPGSEGTCSNVPAGGADPTGQCGNDACTDGCNGQGGCRRQSAGSTCGGASCNANGARTTRVCNANGACTTRVDPCPAARPRCEAGTCRAPAPPACTSANCQGPCRICVADRCVNAPGGTDCPGGQCRGGSCMPTCTPASCTGNRAECRDGRCVGTCSAQNCSGPCRACSGNNRACRNANEGGACGNGGTCQAGACRQPRPPPTCSAATCPGPCKRCVGARCMNTNGVPCGDGGICRGGTCRERMGGGGGPRD